MTARLVIGDFNLTAEDVADLADRVGGVMVKGSRVDHAIISDEVRLEVVRRDLPRYGSDHEPLLLAVRVAGERIVVLWWNVYVGQHPDHVLRGVAELADRFQPDVIALGETYRVRKVLGTVPGYKRIQGRPGRGRLSERAELAILVRRNVTIVARGWVHMRVTWTGPKHALSHGPRIFPRVRIRVGAAELAILAVHLPTGGYTGRNGPAVRETAARIVRWSTRDRREIAA